MNPYVYALSSPAYSTVISDVAEFIFVQDKTSADSANAIPSNMHHGSEKGGFVITTAFLRTRSLITFTLSANVSNGDTIVINGVTYTFVTSVTASQQILIGSTAADTVANLVTRINTDTATLLLTATDLGGGTASLSGVSAVDPVLVEAVTTGNVHTITYTNTDATATVQLITYNRYLGRYCYNSSLTLTGNGCVEFVAHVGARPFGFLVTSLTADSAITLTGYIANDLVGRP